MDGFCAFETLTNQKNKFSEQWKGPKNKKKLDYEEGATPNDVAIPNLQRDHSQPNPL